MARWTAKCWLGSKSGYVDLEVNAATINGAREQLEDIYGAEQIINLREIRSSGGSNSSSDDYSGWLIIAGIVFCIWLIVEYWWIIVPIAVVIGIIAIIGMMD